MDNCTVKKQKGSMVLYVIAGIAAVSVMAVIGTQVYTSIMVGNQRANLVVNSGQILTQAAYTLTTETNTAGSYPVAPAFLVAAPNPTNGGQIPTTSAAPKVDAWGTAIGYCTNTAAAQGDPVFAVISAGADKTFQTTCAQALVGTVAGDDGVRAKNVANIKQGVGGTVYWGDPVASLATLESLTVARAGELRSTKDTGSLYINKTGTPGQGYWSLIGGVSAVAAAVPNPPVVTPPTGGGGSTPFVAALPTTPTVPSLVPTVPQTGGTLWSVGPNSNGQLGLGDLLSHAGINQVGLDANWGEVAATRDDASFGIKTDGTLWSWGSNKNYLLGNASVALNANLTTPTQVGADNKWSSVSAEGFTAIGIKSDGTLWGWGTTMLGDNQATNSTNPATIPKQIGTDTNWAVASVGSSHVLALKQNGSLWAWGDNNQGCNGTQIQNWYPIQVGIDTDWVAVQAGSAISVALKSNGTLWVWGNNQYGLRGDGTVGGSAILNPTQVGTANNWAVIRAFETSTMAINTSGELWVWGRDTFHNLGVGQAGGSLLNLTNVAGLWSSVSMGQVQSSGIKTDGTLWNWGWGWGTSTGLSNQNGSPSNNGGTFSTKTATGYIYRLMIKP